MTKLPLQLLACALIVACSRPAMGSPRKSKFLQRPVLRTQIQWTGFGAAKEGHPETEEDLDRVSYWADHLSGEGRMRVLKEPVPTQFELAMAQTVTAVKAGAAPDPAMRRPDGTPGTLLDALLPDGLTEEAREHHRRKLRKLQYAASWRFFGANILFLNGPTLATLNVSYYRYISVNPLRAVDWRSTIFMTPVQAQYDCASCWAMAAADTVAMATAIATGRPAIPAGVQQLCDCAGLECCQGGWPEEAFAAMVSVGNVTTSAHYNYWSTDDRNCTLDDGYPTAGNITGWEEVPSYSMRELMKAVNMQPVLVYVAASSKDFQEYTSGAPGTGGFNVYTGNCSNEVNHAMVVVGYSTTAPDNYWILKNTWPAFGWGHNGYMYIAMEDGPGKCGMQTVGPIFPTYFPKAPVQATVPSKNLALFQSLSRFTFPVLASSNYWWTFWQAVANPCVGIINPCGAGLCYNSGGLARCLCPAGFVEILNAPTSKCVDPTPCDNSLFNPCGTGTCQNVGDGSYFCLCPLGLMIGTLVNGAPTCIPLLASNSSANTYVTQYGDTCQRIQDAYNVSADTFSSLNPYVLCYGLLLPGIAVLLPRASSTLCTAQYALRPSDRCSQIAYLLDKQPQLFFSTYSSAPGSSVSFPSSYPLSSLLSLNPRLDCGSLFAYQVVCVQSSVAAAAAATPLRCGLTYTTAARDTCSTVRAKFSLNTTYFQRLNPGVNCIYSNGVFSPGNQLCVASSDNAAAEIPCTEWYTVQQGDSCPHIWNAANLSQFQLQYINPGLQCQTPFLYVGLQVCLRSPALANIADPGYLLYTVQPRDTWSLSQAQFSSKCKADSIRVERIAAQNNISDWFNYTLAADTILVIPCVAKIGATCGCAPSLPVCGADLVNYNSYCDARCNFATPTATNPGPCSDCQNACAGQYGREPKPKRACPDGYVCPWPQWPPSLTDASSVFSTSPLCSYRMQTCAKACALFKSTNNINPQDTVCYNTCMACHRVPCSGPSDVIAAGSDVCPTCPKDSSGGPASPGCIFAGKKSCRTDCSYWNTQWSPLNP